MKYLEVIELLSRVESLPEAACYCDGEDACLVCKLAQEAGKLLEDAIYDEHAN